MQKFKWDKDQIDLSLLDEDFLIALQEQTNREVFARIATLDINENPIEYIQGQVTDGSISVDGNSAVRRTCNLSLFAENVDINDVYWGIKTKFKLEIGLKNNLTGDYATIKDYKSYPEIVWFPQGVFVITSFNTAISTKGYTISIAGKDKMILLNGEIGGSLFASVDFGKEEVREIKLTEVTGQIQSSSSLLTRQHYYEIKDLAEFTNNNWWSIDTNNNHYIPLENSLQFIFVQDSKGEFFKLNDRYWPLEEYDYYQEGGYYYRLVQIKQTPSTIKGFSAIGAIPITRFQSVSSIVGSEGRYYLYTYDDEDYELNIDYYQNLNSSLVKLEDGILQYCYLDPTSFPLPWAEDGEHVLFSTQTTEGEQLAKYKIEYYEIYKGPRYKVYKAVEKPSELFELLTGNEDYEKNKYYFARKYPNDNEELYFELNQTNDFKNRNIYNNYKIKTFYTWNYEYTKTQVPLAKIIREGLHAYAGEPYHNIIVNDLEDYGLEQLTYKGDTPLYAFRNVSTGHFSMLAMDVQIVDQSYYVNEITHKCYITPQPGTREKTFSRAATIENPNFKYDNLSLLAPEDDVNKVEWFDYVGSDLIEQTYTIAKIEYGDDIGYRVTDLTYTGDLIANIGESLTSILDKIKSMLGEFEYFYDIDGRFIFQKKKTYVNTVWSQITNTDDDIWVDYGNTDHKRISFSFEGNKVFTAVNNSPNLTNLKNDFIVWGKRKSTNGNEYPIHARYAIDKKPKEYLALDGTLYYTEEALLFPSPEQSERITNHNNIATDTRNLNRYPQVLVNVENGVKTSDWWELSDWANYYAAITGAYPSQQFRTYATEPFLHDTITFDDGSSKTFSGGGQLMIDFKKSKLPASYPLYTTRVLDPTTGQRGSTRYWDPFQHSFRGCGHWYSQYQGFYQNYEDMITYIYKPRLPSTEVIEADGGQVKIVADDTKLVDWRELIYQMAIDYFAAQGSTENPIYNGYTGALVLDSPDKFLQAVGERNPYYYPTGYTGYEQYYTDMQGFWRDLYDPYYVPKIKYIEGYYSDEYISSSESIYNQKQKIWHDESIDEITIDYYVDITNKDVKNALDIAQSHYPNPNGTTQEKNKFKELDADKQQMILNIYKYSVDLNSSTEDQLNKKSLIYWNRNVFEDTSNLKFWIDFLDDANELAQFSVKAVGDRTKVVNEDKIKAIIYKEVPDILLFSTYSINNNNNQNPAWKYSEMQYLQNAVGEVTGYSYVLLPAGFEQYFSLSTQSISAKDKIDELIYQFGYCIENITITSLPVYQLQPNTRIYVRDDKTGINGEYIVTKFTIPLKHSGTMSINATKAPERLY